jgi:flagellar basal-body rod modification protein FlgD
MAVSGIGSNSGTSGLSGSRSTIAENFDTFLQLLTTQLKNQNPLDPLDTNQFTQQLVQFTSVEQQLKTNEFLQAMMASQSAAASAQATSYIGKVVTSSGSVSELSDGEATFHFRLEDAAEKVTVTIRDKDGNVVYTETGKMPAGEGQFVWDGKGSDGVQRPDGTYGVTIDARDADGGFISATTQMSGTVTGVDLTGSEPVLMVGTTRVNLSTVTSVRAAAAS